MTKSTRRKFIIRTLSALGLIGLSAWLGKRKILTWIVRQDNGHEPKMTLTPNIDDEICVLSSPISEGPYYIKSPLKSDIRENRKGKTLNLKFQIVDYPGCNPIENAVVEIWQCDADGNYSGYIEGIGHNIWESAKQMEFGKKEHIEPSNESAYLRGYQKTDLNGNAEFTTIIPGWYDPRVPHIHYKVILNDKEHLTSELYFEEDFCNELFTSVEPYNQYGESPYDFRNDKSLAKVKEGTGLILNPKNKSNNTVLATAKIGIKLT
jgi:protocatechuate 3,4-dioxygenase beta subunit